jgi:hypothetical protein
LAKCAVRQRVKRKVFGRLIAAARAYQFRVLVVEAAMIPVEIPESNVYPYSKEDLDLGCKMASLSESDFIDASKD